MLSRALSIVPLTRAYSKPMPIWTIGSNIYEWALWTCLFSGSAIGVPCLPTEAANADAIWQRYDIKISVIQSNSSTASEKLHPQTYPHPHTCTHTNTHSPTHKRRKKVSVEKDFHEKEERCSSRERERTHWLRITPFLVPSTSKPQPKILLTVNGPFSQPFWFKRAHAHAHALEHTLTRTQTLRLSLACLHIWIHRNHLSPARASTHTRNSHTHFDR